MRVQSHSSGATIGGCHVPRRGEADLALASVPESTPERRPRLRDVSLRSRYEEFDQKVRLHGQRQIARGWHRPSFIGLSVMTLLIVIFLLRSAGR